jgi:hypothetical protein
VRVEQFVSAVVAMEVPAFACLPSNCNHVPKAGDCQVCDNRVEGCHTKRQVLCGCKPAIIHLYIIDFICYVNNSHIFLIIDNNCVLLFHM